MLLKDAASTGIVTVIGAVSGANLVLSSPGDFVTVVNTGSDWKTMAKRLLFLPLRSTAGTGGTTAELILLEQQMRMILL
jgi:hypothetical protein